MKHSFTLTRTSPPAEDYFTKGDIQLCADKLIALFPAVKNRRRITLTVSTKRQRKAGEKTFRYQPADMGSVPYVFHKGKEYQILTYTGTYFERLLNLKQNSLVYVQIH